MQEDRSRESKEERAKRHQEKAKAVQAHRSQIRAQLSRQNASQKLRGSTQFHCPLKFDNRCAVAVVALAGAARGELLRPVVATVWRLPARAAARH